MDTLKNDKKLKGDGLALLLCSLLFVFFAASGSIFYNTKFLNLEIVEALVIPLLLLGIWVSRCNYITLTKMHIWFALLILMYFYNNGTVHPIISSYPVVILLMLMSLRISVSWFDNVISILKVVYIFYAIYTILMRIHPIFLQIALWYFNKETSKKLMLEQYYNGCMVGFTNHYSTNGMLLATGAIIFFTEFISNRRIRDAIWSFIFSIALLLTGKRAHVIFTFLAVFVGYYVNESADKKTRRKRILLVVVLTLVFAFVIVQYIPSLATFITRFAETEEEGDITLGRTRVWQTVLQLFLAHPIMGIGWGQFLAQGYWKYNAHNIYLQLLGEIGIVGSAIYFGFFLFMLFKTWSLLQKLRERGSITHESRMLLFSLSFQVFFLLYGFTGNPLYDQIMYIPYFFACGITLNSMENRFAKEL